MSLNSDLDIKTKNLQNLKIYLNIFFQKTLSQLTTKNNFWTQKLQSMEFLSKLFLSIEKIYDVKSFFYYGKKSKNSKKLFVYIAEKVKLLGIDEKRIEQQIIKNFKQGDYLISIGENAINFADRNKINSLLSFEKNNIKNLKQIQTIVFEFFISKRVEKIIFVFNSNKLVDNQVTILPIENFFLKKQEKNQNFSFNIKDFKIFPNLDNFLENMGIIYINNIVSSLITEAELFPLKQLLSKLQNNMNEIDEKIKKIQLISNKIKSDAINREILLISQTSSEDNFEDENE